MAPALPDGVYPFADRRLPLADLAFAECPVELERLLRDQANANGLQIIRDKLVELKCAYVGEVEATFLIWRPRDEPHIHVLMPRADIRGRA